MNYELKIKVKNLLCKFLQLLIVAALPQRKNS